MQAIESMLIRGGKVVNSDLQAVAEKFIWRGDLTAVTTTAVGGALSIQNTTGRTLLITLCYIDVTTPSTGAATVDIGVDTGGDTSNDTLIDGVDVNTAAIQASNLVGGGTKGNVVKWVDDDYIVATASASLAGLVGTYYIEAVPIA